jgi:hypothetical protein
MRVDIVAARRRELISHRNGGILHIWASMERGLGSGGRGFLLLPVCAMQWNRLQITLKGALKLQM